MKRLLIFLLLAGALQAQTTFTPNLNLQLPPRGSVNWDVAMNANFATIDSFAGQMQNQFRGTWSAVLTYSKGQMVTYQGGLYFSTSFSNLNNTPSSSPTFWALMSTALPPSSSANLVYAGPDGSSGAPTFRSLVAGDLPAPLSGTVVAHRIYVGPVSGSATAPTFRVIDISDLPAPFSGVTSAQGNGVKMQLATGTTVSGDCARFDANGNIVDDGNPCGVGIPSDSTAAIKPPSLSKIQFADPAGSGSDGLSWGTARTTCSAAVTALGTSAAGVLFEAPTLSSDCIASSGFTTGVNGYIMAPTRHYFGPLAQATSGSHKNSMELRFAGSQWNGSAAVDDYWQFRVIEGSNPVGSGNTYQIDSNNPLGVYRVNPETVIGTGWDFSKTTDGFLGSFVRSGWTAGHTITIPNANTVTVVPSSAPANQVATGISTVGTVSYAQLGFSNLSGTANLATQVAGVLTPANGGTGQTTAAAAFNALSPLTTPGDLLYYGSSSAVRLPGNTLAARRWLAQTGTGINAQAPAWSQPSVTDLSEGTTGTSSVVRSGAPSLQSPTLDSPTFTTTLTPSNALKHQTFGTTCTTPSTPGFASACNVSYSWSAPFSDVNYQFICMGEAPNGGPITLDAASHTSASITLTVTSITGAAINYFQVQCIAMK